MPNQHVRLYADSCWHGTANFLISWAEYWKQGQYLLRLELRTVILNHHLVTKYVPGAILGTCNRSVRQTSPTPLQEKKKNPYSHGACFSLNVFIQKYRWASVPACLLQISLCFALGIHSVCCLGNSLPPNTEKVISQVDFSDRMGLAGFSWCLERPLPAFPVCQCDILFNCSQAMPPVMKCCNPSSGLRK